MRAQASNPHIVLCMRAQVVRSTPASATNDAGDGTTPDIATGWGVGGSGTFSDELQL